MLAVRFAFVLVLGVSLATAAVSCGKDVDLEPELSSTEAERTGLLNPLPAGNVRVRSEKGGVTVTWTGNGQELLRYKVMRKASTQNDFVEIGTAAVGGPANGGFSYFDATVVAGESYSYGLKAVDPQRRESDLAGSQSITVP